MSNVGERFGYFSLSIAVEISLMCLYYATKPQQLRETSRFNWNTCVFMVVRDVR